VGLDWLILVLWAAQALVVLALMVRAAFRRQWVAGAGLAAGLAIGLAPLLTDENTSSGRTAVLFGTSIILVALSAIVLVISYSFTRGWIALALVIVIFCIPIPYVFISASSSLKVFQPLEAMGEFDFFLAPIACALAGREILVWARRLVANSKESTA
jgi:hypothetical protein